MTLEQLREQLAMLQSGWMVQNVVRATGHSIALELDETLLNPAVLIRIDGIERSRAYTFLKEEGRLFQREHGTYIDETFDLELFHIIVEKTYWASLIERYDLFFKKWEHYFEQRSDGRMLTQIVQLQWAGRIGSLQMECVRLFAKIYKEEEQFEKAIQTFERKVDEVMQEEDGRLHRLRERLEHPKKQSFWQRLKRRFRITNVK